MGALTPKQEGLPEPVRTDTERLLRIRNDLLDLALFEEGVAELHREKVAPAELLQAVVEDTADKGSARDLKINCAVDPDLPQALVDRQRIGYVFANLLTNAIKHSPANSEVRLRTACAEDHAIQFTVADDGPGIPPQFHQRLFDRFFRVPGQTQTGADLGLSIVREIAVARGGRFSGSSPPGQGATFYLVLKAVDGAQ